MFNHFNRAQIGAIIAYESRLQWRSRAWSFILFAALSTTVIGLLLIAIIQFDRPIFSRSMVVYTEMRTLTFDQASGTFTPEVVRVIDPAVLLPAGALEALSDAQIARLDATIKGFFVLWFALLMLLFAVPVFMADIIPRDRQWEVRPLLDSTPLTPASYLLGKVLSIWANLLLTALGVLALCAMLVRALFGEFDVGLYVWVSLTGVLPACLFVGAVTVLIPAGLRARRAAMFVGVLLLPLAGLAYFKTIVDLWGTALLLEPLLHFAVILPSRWQPPATLASVAAETYAWGALIAAASALWAWSLLRRQIASA